MTQIASLPTLKVEIAFNPTDLLNLTQTWTDVSLYVRNLGTHGGRQHYLDRIEASTLSLTLDNRTGFFMNGDYSSVTAVSSTGSVVTYTCANSFTAGSNVTITGVTGGSGGQPYSGTYVVASANSTQFTVANTQTGAATLSSATAVTRPVISSRLPIRATATWNSVAYTVFWGVIDTVDTSLADALNADLYVSASDSLKYLSLRYLWNESLYDSLIASSDRWYNQANNGALPEQNGSGANGSVSGLYAQTDGVLLYSKSQATDLTNGSTTNSTGATALLPVDFMGAEEFTSIEFWVIGQAIASTTLLPLNAASLLPAYHQADIAVNASGQPYINYYNGNTYTAPQVINDGYWHHVAVRMNGAQITLIVDGNVTTGPTASGYAFLVGNPDNFFHVGNGTSCFIDQMVVSASSTLNDIKNRYIAGSLLRKDTNAADRIAQALVIGGRGSVSGGTISVPNYYINGPSNPYTGAQIGSASNGTVICQGTLSSVTTISALDAIFEAVDTEIGVFYQGDDGNLNFHTRQYLYRPTGNATPTGAYVWTDDTTSSYHYEAPSFQLTRDDVDTWTTVIISPTNGLPQIYTAPSASQLRWGQSTLTKSSTGSTLEGSYQTAVYLGKVFASPLPRVNNLKLMSETDNGSNLDAMLGVNLQDRITVKRTPINASSAGITNTDMSVESLNHEFAADPGFWHTTVTLDPYPIRFSTQTSPTYFLVADDATYGIASTNTAL